MKERIYTCAYCGCDYTPNRSDQKYCDQQCRYAHNNEKKREEKKRFKSTEDILKKNHQILERLKPKGLVSRDVLNVLGYNFNHFTGSGKKGGLVFVCCYDLCLINLTNGNYKITNYEL